MKNIIIEVEQVNTNTLMECSLEIDKINREKFNNNSKLLINISSICMLKLIDIKSIRLDESMLVDLTQLVKGLQLNYKLKSRLADILWLKINSKEKIEYLKIAIENYMKYPLNIVFYNEWDRAISLLVSTKEDTNKVKTMLLETFLKTSELDSIFIKFLNKYNKKVFKYDNSLLREICENKLNNLTTNYDKQDFLENYIEFYDDCKDEKYIELVDYYAKTIDEDNLDEIIGYSKIITCLHKIKNKQKYNVSEQLKKIQNTKIEFQKNISYQKTEISINISEYVQETEQLLKDKSTIEIFYSLGSFEDNIIDSLENIDENDKDVFSELIDADLGVFNNDGRKVLEKLSPQDQYYANDLNFFLYTKILPSLKILSEHNITEQLVLELCEKSSLIPNDRIKIFSKGLYYGFKKEFIVSTSLLVPQIEHLLRMNLKYINENTINYKRNDGIEEEMGIDRLLDENIKKFEKTIYQEFKLILTKPFNLRNDVAHGLISDEYFQTQLTIYFWWLVLKLIINDIENGNK